MRLTTRALVLIFMIALLPLRGWAGEIMATEMASTQAMHSQKLAESATKLGADRDRIDWSKATLNSKNVQFSAQNQPLADKASGAVAAHDCERHTKSDATAAANADANIQADSHCDTCPACQACHTVALSFGAVSLSAALSPRMLPHAAADHFASATAALGQKPPIS
jgi:hypothetical protein